MKRFLLKCCCLFLIRKDDRDRFRLKHGLKKAAVEELERDKLFDKMTVHEVGASTIIEIDGVFFHPPFIGGMWEVFGRRDYEFGGLDRVIFVDVGANIGDSTLFAATRKEVEKVYAYECFPAVYNVLVSNVELNPALKSKIVLFSEGWSDRCESIPAWERQHITESVLNTLEDDFSQRDPDASLREVNVVLKRASEVLRQICALHPHNPIVLKMDIEGAEYKCIDDLDKSHLLKQVDIVFMEWHLRGYDCIVKILENNQFVWFNEQFEKGIGFLRAYRKK